MGDIKGFLKVKRQPAAHRPVCERIRDFRDVAQMPAEAHSKEQASRCMDCGTPFCNWGCPVGNYIPEWNDLVFRGRWQRAFELLDAANNLPEITGRICPAPCEPACVLGINDDPVTIRENELAIIEQAFKRGLIKARAPQRRSTKKAAVVGSGPAGLACAAQLNRAGHKVTVFERDAAIGGILRFGIPDFKLEKPILDRRIKLWEKEGIIFKTGVDIGADMEAAKLMKDFDAVCLCGGSRIPRDLNIEGRNLHGIHFAMEYLIQSNLRVAGRMIPPDTAIDARGRKVVVIGGGDTGADCVGVAHRQGAACVIQIELMPQPPDCRSPDYPWPKYPMILKTSTSHEEGGRRQWSILTRRFSGASGRVKKLVCVKVVFGAGSDKTCPIMREVPGSEFEIEADLVVLALGFLHPEKKGPIAELKLDLDSRGNVKTDGRCMTSRKGVFAAGDMRRGQSLIVWAIAEGRRAAHCIDAYLMGKSSLPFI